jgi:hypothetical protein
MKKTDVLSVAIGCSGVLLAAAALTAGPLDPPTGAIAPSYKTLTEVEPRIAINLTNTPGDADSTFKITQPGSYYLTQNFVTKAGSFSGIEIAAPNVTIDLNGFTLSGNNAAMRPGIIASAVAENVSICNGSIVDYRNTGIELTNSVNVSLENLRVKNCLNGGYLVTGAYRISRCIANNNSAYGFNVSGPGIIQDSVANQSSGTGFMLENQASAISCTASGHQVKGFMAYSASLVNCSASNSPIGIQGSGATLVGCSATACTETGINLQSSNATSCTANQNGQNGFRLTGANLNQCVANGNNSNGVIVGYDSTVRDSSFMYNGVLGSYAGIYVYGDGNRIEGNNSGYQDIGVYIVGTRNFVSRNTCRGNGNNWNVVATNACFVVNATTGGAINGNAGGAPVGSNDPNANFSY